MRLGFSTNSIGDIDPLDALPLLAELGYTSLALTLDRHTIDPFAADLSARIDRWRRALAASGMTCVIETGARHLLDVHVKHEPTFVTADPEARGRRVGFTRRAIDIAAAVGADCVSMWSGVVRDAAPGDVVWDRLSGAMGPVIDQAAKRGVAIGFEPEPGMFIDTLDRYGLLRDRLGRPESLRLTVDLGHLECMGERPLATRLAAYGQEIVNVHVDDMLACRHEHLPLGRGDIEFAPLLASLTAACYPGGLHVELPRQSHRWLETARDSAAMLCRMV